MDKTRIITIICWCISALALTGFVIWLVFASPLFGIGWGWARDGGNWFSNVNVESLTGPFDPAGSHSLSQDGIDSFDIDWVAGSIEIRPHDGNDILITEFAQRELNDNERMRVATSDSTVTVSFREGTGRGNMPPKRLEILVPQPLSDNLESLVLSASSGSTSVSDIDARLIDLDSTSGGFTITNVNAGSITLGSTSGTINISDSNAMTLRTNATSGTQNISGSFEDATIRGTSGSLNITDFQARTLDTNVTSGTQNISGTITDANLRGTSGRLTFESDASFSSIVANVTSGTQNISGSFDTVDVSGTSGSKTVLSRIVPSSLRVDSTSGRIDITIPNEGAISVHHSSTSGRFSSDIPVIMQAGDAQFRISSTSGNVNINELN
jgi:DUF4097 and DUF4098 domain-containing protein YvlB